MANDRETKSVELKPERPQDSSAALRAGGGETMTEAPAAPATLSSSRTGDRRQDDDMSDIGGTDKMTAATGGLAGTSR